jgi:FkbM family methyltransferase
MSMLPPMVSYAQNGEDVVLRRVFAELQSGFYVDVGPSVPDYDSVTLHFYEHGWSGVNVEPDLSAFEELVRARVRDVNINAAVGSKAGPITFYPSVTRGQGTLVEPASAEMSPGSPRDVPQISLHQVLSDHAPPNGVDFLKVDVEGWEADVLDSTDWTAVRPRVILVEAVDADGRPTHESWEPRLLESSYRFGLFDGLNRFYCREEDAGLLLPRLAAPANVLDNWRLAREIRVQEELVQRLSECEAARASLRAALADEQTALESEQVAHGRARAVVAEMQASTSWRVTARLRNVSRLASLMRRNTRP